MIISLIIFSLLWLLLTEASWMSLIIGVPAIFLAAYTGKLITGGSPYSISLISALRFFVYFVAESFKGGFDIARRAFGVTPNVQPVYIHYKTSLPEGLPQILFSGTVSLLPGTLMADRHENTLLIHSLVSSNEIEDELIHCEQHIQNIFVLNQTGPRSEK